MAQVIQELVSEPFPLVRAGDKSRDIQKFNWHGTPSLVTAAVVGLASVRQIVSFAGAVDLEVADGSLGIDCGEAKLVLEYAF